MKISTRTRWVAAITATFALLMSGLAMASSVSVVIVDITAPSNAVTIPPGGSSPITLTMTVSGSQAGTATFEVYRDWVLNADGTFTGSNPQEYTVGPRAANAAPSIYNATGTVTATSAHPGGTTHTLAVVAFDITNSNTTGSKLAAGAASNYEVTVRAPSDTTPPIVTPTVTGTLGNDDWYTSDVSVAWVTSDLESSITSVVCGATQLTADTLGEVVTCIATSAGGTTSQSVSIKRDATAPVIIPGDVDDTTWRNVSLTESFTATDATSGLADAADSSFSLTVSDESADASTPTTSGRTVTDQAGNSATRSISALIDLTDPTVSLVGGPSDGASYHMGFDVPAAPTCIASDTLSGLAGPCTVTGFIALQGTHQMGASATDNAGNTGTSDTVSYSVAAQTLRGLYAPVDMNGVHNTVKAGSAVPLKFELFAGTTEITDLSRVMVRMSSPYTCTGAAVEDAIETLSSGTTALRYDPVAGQFIQNWKTPTNAAGKCVTVTVSAPGTGATPMLAIFKMK